MTDEPEIQEDRGIYPVLIALQACVDTQLEQAGLPVERVDIAHGGDWVLDMREGDCSRQAWLHLTNVFPSSAFPEQDQTPIVNAPLAYEVQIGYAFCTPVVDQWGNEPGVPELVDAIREQTAAMAAVHAAVCACMDEQDRQFVLTSYLPSGPEAGLTWATWTLMVEGR